MDGWMDLKPGLCWRGRLFAATHMPVLLVPLPTGHCHALVGISASNCNSSLNAARCYAVLRFPRELDQRRSTRKRQRKASMFRQSVGAVSTGVRGAGESPSYGNQPAIIQLVNKHRQVTGFGPSSKLHLLCLWASQPKCCVQSLK